MHVTLDDDVVGLVPQLRPTVLHKVIQELHRHGWTGFVARERFPGDHDAVLAYLARAAWDQEATPQAVTRDLIGAVCGERSVEDMVAALNLTESATLNLATGRAEGPVAEGAVWSQRLDVPFAFYVPGMMMKFWRPRPIPAYLSNVQRDYRHALEAARRAAEKANPRGRWYPDYWVGRLEFALGYANAVEALHRGGAAEAAKKSGEALSEAEKALVLVRSATESYARVARNRTDLGAIAVMNEYGYRALKGKIAELKK